MRYLLAMLALSCGLSSAQAADSVLTVLLTGTDVPLVVLAEMEHEASTAFEPSAFTLIWKTDEDRQGDFVVNGRMALIYMRGHCLADPLAGARTSTVSAGAKLGLTHIADGQVLPIAEILCDMVRDFVGPKLRLASAANRDIMFGRALGRVLAHELYHIVLQSTGHGSSGLSHGEQRSTDLLVPQLSFRPLEALRIADSGRLGRAHQ